MLHLNPTPEHAWFDFTLASLEAVWPQLHSIDGEPFPSVDRVSRSLKETGSASNSTGDPIKSEQTTEALTTQLQHAWLAFHQGRFDEAYQLGCSLGPLGSYVAHLAVNVYGVAFVAEENRAAFFQQAITELEREFPNLPQEANFHYVHALHLGRYSESISTAKAVSGGSLMAFKRSVEHCLVLEPGHIPSKLAYAALMAEAIGAVGEFAAKLTFGATKQKVLACYEETLALNNPPPVVYLEFAKGLILLDKKKQRERIVNLLRQALEAPVLDALDRIDLQIMRPLFTEYNVKLEAHK